MFRTSPWRGFYRDRPINPAVAVIGTPVPTKPVGCVRWLPLWAWLAYFLFTLACFQCGFHIFGFVLEAKHYVLLYGYLLATTVAFIFGYARGSACVGVAPSDQIRLPLLQWILAAGTFIFVVVDAYNSARTGTTIGAGMQNLSDVRAMALETSGGVFGHLTLIFSVFTVPLIALTFIWWRELTVVFRVWALILIAYLFLRGVAGGSRSAGYGALCFISIALAAALCGRRIKISLPVLTLGCLGVVMAFLIYSSWVTLDRSKLDRDADYLGWLEQVQEVQGSVKFDHPLLPLLPKPIAPAIITTSFYFGHSYNNLAYSLAKPNEGWGFGIGHAAVFVRTFARLFGSQVYLCSKPFRMQIEEGTSESLWYTAYMWIASDTTYLGSILVFYWFGILMGRTWICSLSGCDFWSAVALIWIWAAMTLVHNCFIAGDYGAWIGFFGSIVMFYRTRGRGPASGIRGGRFQRMHNFGRRR